MEPAGEPAGEGVGEPTAPSHRIDLVTLIVDQAVRALYDDRAVVAREYQRALSGIVRKNQSLQPSQSHPAKNPVASQLKKLCNRWSHTPRKRMVIRPSQVALQCLHRVTIQKVVTHLWIDSRRGR